MTPPPAPKLLKLRDVPAYVERKTGLPVTRQTAFNWARYGKQGRKLKITNTPRGKYTTEKWLDEFLSNISR